MNKLFTIIHKLKYDSNEIYTHFESLFLLCLYDKKPDIEIIRKEIEKSKKNLNQLKRKKMNKSIREIGEAIQCWNRMFEWSAKKCDDKLEGKKIAFLLIKILKPLKQHPDYSKIDGNYDDIWETLTKNMKEYEQKIQNK